MKVEKRLGGARPAEKCSRCGARMEVCVSTSKEPYLYEMSGLDNVRLVGVKVLTCKGCGDEAVQIPQVGQLHRVIAHAVFHKSGLLNGGEVRFLRKNAGLLAKDFAAFVGISPEHLSRVENGKTESLGEPADKLARVVAMAPCANTEEYQGFLRSAGASTLSKVASEKKVFRLKNSVWAEAV